MLPDFVKVGLQQSDIIQRGLQAVPLVHHLVGVRLIPE